MNTYISDPSDFCPGCNARFCECPPPGYEDVIDDAAYQAGYDDCLDIGYDQRPTPMPSRWADPCTAAYYRGFDDAGAGLPSEVEDPSAHAACARALDGGEPMPELSEHLYGPWPVSDGLPF